MRIRSALAVFFISVFILFPIRLSTLSSGVDLSGDLFSGGALNIVFSSVLILSALLILIISWKSVNVPSYVRVVRSIPCTFASIIMAGLIAFDSVLSFGGEYYDVYTGNRAVIYGISGILAAAALIVFAVSFLTGNPIASRIPIVSLLPAIWACVRLTLMFMNYTTIADISIYYFDICYYICLLVFLFGQAKVFSSIETRKSAKFCTCSGLLCCIFSLLSVGSRFYINNFKDGDFTTGSVVPRVMDIFIIAYILCYLFFITNGSHRNHSREEIQFVFKPNGNFGGFWDDWNTNTPQVEQVNSTNAKVTVNPINEDNRLEKSNLIEQIEQLTQTVPLSADVQYEPAEQQVNVAENIPVQTAVQNVQTVPVTLPAPADYYEDDDNISIFPDKKLLKSELNYRNIENSASGDSEHPIAHIEKDIEDITATAAPALPVANSYPVIPAIPVATAGTTTVAPAAYPVVPNFVPNYIATPDGVYVRIVDPAAENQVVNVSPDETPVVNNTPEKNPDRPVLGKGYVPDNTVRITEDGYCIVNCPDE